MINVLNDYCFCRNNVETKKKDKLDLLAVDKRSQQICTISAELFTRCNFFKKKFGFGPLQHYHVSSCSIKEHIIKECAGEGDQMKSALEGLNDQGKRTLAILSQGNPKMEHIFNQVKLPTTYSLTIQFEQPSFYVSSGDTHSYTHSLEVHPDYYSQAKEPSSEAVLKKVHELLMGQIENHEDSRKWFMAVGDRHLQMHYEEKHHKWIQKIKEDLSPENVREFLLKPESQLTFKNPQTRLAPRYSFKSVAIDDNLRNLLNKEAAR